MSSLRFTWAGHVTTTQRARLTWNPKNVSGRIYFWDRTCFWDPSTQRSVVLAEGNQARKGFLQRPVEFGNVEGEKTFSWLLAISDERRKKAG